MDGLIITILILTIILSFAVGGQDESMATVYGSGSLKMRTALMIGFILAVFGVIFLSEGVSKTIGASLLGDKVEYNAFMMLAVLLSTTTWLIVSSRTGVPISTTHTVVGAVFGLSIVWAITTNNSLLDGINWASMGRVFLGWVISPILGLFVAIGAQYIVNYFLKHSSTGLLKVEHSEKIFRNLIIGVACLNQISRAGNDSANAIGVFFGLSETGDVPSTISTYFIIISAFAFAFGLVVIGRHVIETVGTTTGQLRPSEALAVEGTTAGIILIATLLGLPVSGAHILVFALIGSAKMKGERPDAHSFRRMVISWLITFPLAAGLSALYYGILIGL